MQRERSFRQDLYYRLSVFPIEIPPLRERLEDIPLLVDSILQRLNRVHARRIDGIQPEVSRAFEDYAWPGNVRELENLLERAFILETSRTLTPRSFPAELFAANEPFAAVPVHAFKSLAEARRAAIEGVERRYLAELLALHGGRIAETAAAAGIGPRQLHKLLTRHGIRKEDFRRREITSAIEPARDAG